MNFNIDLSTVRGGGVSADFNVGRGSQSGAPKKTFGQKLDGTSPSDDALWRAEIDRVHSRLRNAMSVGDLAKLLDYYAVLAAIRAKRMSRTAPFVPGGTVLSAAIGAVNKHVASSGG